MISPYFRKYLAILLFPFLLSYSQWSTSTIAESAMFVCPGFWSKVIADDEGSIIVIGIGDFNEVWMQKTNQFGIKLWEPYVTVMGPQSSVAGQPILISDGNGGAYVVQGKFGQRVNRNGLLSWNSSQQQLLPSSYSIVQFDAVQNDANGLPVLFNAYDASKSLQVAGIVSIDTAANKLWFKVIDSNSVQNSMNVWLLGRMGGKTFIRTSQSGFQLVSNTGEIEKVTDSLLHSHFFVSDKNSGYNVYFKERFVNGFGEMKQRLLVSKFSNTFETVWSQTIEIEDFNILTYTGSLKILIPDGYGGVFFFRSFEEINDSLKTQINRINHQGKQWDKSVIISEEVGTFPFSSPGYLGFIFQSKRGQKIDMKGNFRWQNDYRMISDPFNAYVPSVTSDNNGGAVMSYWTKNGGIYLKHSGRYGEVGKLMGVKQNALTEMSISLGQNYPNPFNSKTNISYSLSNGDHIEISLYDMIGRKIKMIHSGYRTAGVYRDQINLADLASGTYVLKFKNTAESKSIKLINLK